MRFHQASRDGWEYLTNALKPKWGDKRASVMQGGAASEALFRGDATESATGSRFSREIGDM